VFEVNDEIVLVQLAEIDLGTVTFSVVKPPTRVRRETAEQFSRRQNDQIGRRKTKATRERAENKINILQHIGADQFTEALDLALGLKINHDPRFIFTPLVQSLDELIALRFREEKIANRELADVAILKRAAEIFGTAFDPALADLNNLSA